MMRVALSSDKGLPLLVGVSLAMVACSPMIDCIEPQRFEVVLAEALEVSFDGTGAFHECGIEDLSKITVEVSTGKDEDDTRDWTGTSCRISHAQIVGPRMRPAGRIRSDDIQGITGTYRELAVGRMTMTGGGEYLAGLLCDSREICTWEQPHAQGAKGAIIFELEGSDPPCAQAFEVELQ